MAAAAATTLLALVALANGQVISHRITTRLPPTRSSFGSVNVSGSGFQQTCFQVLDRNCFSDENGTLSDTFLDRTGDEEAKVAVSENLAFLVDFFLPGNCLWWGEGLCCQLDQSLVLKVSSR